MQSTKKTFWQSSFQGKIILSNCFTGLSVSDVTSRKVSTRSSIDGSSLQKISGTSGSTRSLSSQREISLKLQVERRPGDVIANIRHFEELDLMQVSLTETQNVSGRPRNGRGLSKTSRVNVTRAIDLQHLPVCSVEAELKCEEEVMWLLEDATSHFACALHAFKSCSV